MVVVTSAELLIGYVHTKSWTSPLSLRDDIVGRNSTDIATHLYDKTEFLIGYSGPSL